MESDATRTELGDGEEGGDDGSARHVVDQDLPLVVGCPSWCFIIMGCRGRGEAGRVVIVEG